MSDYPACNLDGDTIVITDPGGGKKNVEFKNKVEQYLRELLGEENSWLNLGLNDSFFEASEQPFSFDNFGLSASLKEKLTGFGGLDDVGFTEAFKSAVTGFEGLEYFGIKSAFANEVNGFGGLDDFGITEAFKNKAGEFGGGEALGIGGDFNEVTRTTSTVTISDPASGAEVDIDRIDSVEFQNDNGFSFKLIFNNI